MANRPLARKSKAIFSTQAWTEICRALKFSDREFEIVRGIFEDRTEFAIAVGLGISPHTVHTHIERLYHKLSVSNRVQLVLRVYRTFLKLTANPGNDLPPICRNSDRCPVCGA